MIPGEPQLGAVQTGDEGDAEATGISATGPSNSALVDLASRALEKLSEA